MCGCYYVLPIVEDEEKYGQRVDFRKCSGFILGGGSLKCGLIPSKFENFFSIFLASWTSIIESDNPHFLVDVAPSEADFFPSFRSIYIYIYLGCWTSTVGSSDLTALIFLMMWRNLGRFFPSYVYYDLRPKKQVTLGLS